MVPDDTAASGPLSGALELLANPRCRHVLSLLASREGSVQAAALAREVANRPGDDGGRIALLHTHLPKLDAAGVVDYDPATGTVRVDEAELANVRETYRALARTGGELSVAEACELLGDGRRRATLSVLGRCDRGEDVSLAGLAAAVAVEERGDTVRSLPDVDTGPVRTTLHHTHLPKLDAADVVDYDADGRRVVPRTRPAVPVGLIDGGTTADAPDSEDIPGDRDAADDATSWRLEGGAAVRERQRALFDHADDELTVIAGMADAVTRPGLTHLDDALERGVDVRVVGPRSVRERVADDTPGAALAAFERSRFRLLPGRGERVTRLVVADGRAALVGTTADAGDRDVEAGVTGDGRDDPLVALATDVTGSQPRDATESGRDGRSRVLP